MVTNRHVLSPARRHVLGLDANAASGGPGSFLARQRLFVSQLPDGSTILDESGGDTSRTLYPGRAYDFDGVDDRLNFEYLIDAGTTASFSAWIYLDATTDFRLAGEDSTNYVFRYDGAQASVQFDGSVQNLSYVPSTGSWFHLCIVRDGNDIEVYVNGSLQQSVTGSFASNTIIRWIATTANADYLNGKLYDVRLYDKALLATEVEHVHSFGGGGTDPTADNCLFWLTCEDNHPAMALDCVNKNMPAKNNISSSTFHYEGSDVPHSYLNNVGFSLGGYFVREDGTGPGSDHIEYPTPSTNGPDYGTPWELAWSSAAVPNTGGGVWGQNGLTQGMEFFGTDSLRVDTGAVINTVTVPGRTAFMRRYRVVYDGAGGIEVFVDGVSVFTGTTTDVGAWGQICIGTRRLSVTSTSFSGLIADAVFIQNGTTIIDSPIDEGSGLSIANNGTGDDGTLDKDSITREFWGVIPASQVNAGQDIFGKSLQFAGQAAYNGSLVNSSCGSFDGINDYALSGSNIALTGAASRSVSFWAKMDSTADSTLFSFGQANTANGALFSARTLSGDWYFNGWGTADWATGEAADTNEHFHVLTYDGSTVRWYVDGVELGSGSAETLNTLSGALYLGARSDLTLHADAKIWGFKIWSDVLTADEREYERTAGESGTDPTTANLVGFWPMAEGGEATLYDVTTGANDMTVNGATVTSGLGFWAETQDTLHYNLTSGFELFDDDATGLELVRVPFTLAALQLTPTITGFTKVRDNSAGAYHNSAETEIDFTGGVAAPGSSGWETAWTFPDARTPPLYRRQTSSGGTPIRADRFVALDAVPTGAELAAVTDFTADRSI